MPATWDCLLTLFTLLRRHRPNPTTLHGPRMLLPATRGTIECTVNGPDQLCYAIVTKKTSPLTVVSYVDNWEAQSSDATATCEAGTKCSHSTVTLSCNNPNVRTFMDGSSKQQKTKPFGKHCCPYPIPRDNLNTYQTCLRSFTVYGRERAFPKPENIEAGYMVSLRSHFC